MKTKSLKRILLTVTILFSGTSLITFESKATDQVYAAADWSDTQNPNSVWAYHAGNLMINAPVASAGELSWTATQHVKRILLSPVAELCEFSVRTRIQLSCTP